MYGEELFLQACVYLAAAVVSVPIAKRLGLGSVLGYLLGGVAIGPFALDLVGSQGEDVMHFAEFGVVMMLFVVGLELRPALLWRLRGPILGLGGLQVVASTAVLGAIAYASGLPLQAAAACGMILALSSTAMVLQTLNEKGLMQTDAGRSSFAVLLFQDIAVIPMLALLPLLGTAAPGSAHGAEHHGSTWVESLPAWGRALAVLGAVGAIVVAGRFLVRPALRSIARARLREVFTAAALLLVVGIALLMTRVGLSPALGTFLAGVVLATSEYRHELESDIEPFKGLLLGVFFLSVGASIDFDLIAAQPARIAAIVALLVAAKFLVLFVLGRVGGMSLDQNLLFAFALAQGGEFCFVLFSFATQNGVLDRATAGPLIAAVALSMGLTPLLMLAFERGIQPRVGTREKGREADAMDEHAPVILAGFGRFGHIVGRFLLANGIRPTVLDVDSDHVDLLRRLGFTVFYGDASRLDLLHAAGAAEARLLIVAVDDEETTGAIVRTATEHFPELSLLVRARGRSHAYELADAGVEHVYRETLDTSLRVGVDALRALGFRAHQAHRAARKFRRHDEAALRELGAARHDRKVYVSRARDAIRELERVLLSDLQEGWGERDAGWDSESLRREHGRPSPPE